MWRGFPRLSVMCGLSLLVLYSTPRGFSPGSPVSPSPQKAIQELLWFDSLISVHSIPNLCSRARTIRHLYKVSLLFYFICLDPHPRSPHTGERQVVCLKTITVDLTSIQDRSPYYYWFIFWWQVSGIPNFFRFSILSFLSPEWPSTAV